MKLFDMDKTSIDFQERKLYIKLTSCFSYILNDFNEESVYFPMYLFTDLHSIYSKNVYRLFYNTNVKKNIILVLECLESF